MSASASSQPSRAIRSVAIGCRVLVGILIVTGLTSSALAQGGASADLPNDPPADSPGEQQSDWRFTVGIYGWLTDVHGELTSPNAELEFTVPFSDIFSHLDAVLEAVGEVRWRRWLFAFDGTWLTLDGATESTLFDLSVQVKQQIYDLHAGYGLYQRIQWDGAEPDQQPWRRVTAVAVILGARNFATQTSLTTLSHATDRQQESSFDASRWDLIIGARAEHGLSRRWNIDLIADIGGFGIGNSADFTYRVDFNLGFRLWQPFTLFAGYRVISFELSSDAPLASGMTIAGPKIGAKFDF